MNNILKSRVVFSAALLLALCFSSISSSRAASVAAAAKRSDATVLVRVNGNDITWGSLNRHVDLMAALLKNKKKNCTEEDIQKFRKKNLKRFSDDLFHRTLMTSGLASSNICVSAKTVNSVKEDFARNYKKKKQSTKAFFAYIEKAGYKKDVEKLLAGDALIRSFVTSVYSNRYYVTEESLATVRKNVAAYNSRAAATNALKVAMGDSLVKRIRAGEDFGKLADRYSEDPEKAGGGDIGECDENDFLEDKEAWKMLSALKEGEISGLLEIEDGYAIYKLIKRKKAEESNSESMALHLARIFIRRAYLFPPQTDDELRVDVERENRERLFSDLLIAFRKQCKVEYPDGHLNIDDFKVKGDKK